MKKLQITLSKTIINYSFNTASFLSQNSRINFIFDMSPSETKERAFGTLVVFLGGQGVDDFLEHETSVSKKIGHSYCCDNNIISYLKYISSSCISMSFSTPFPLFYLSLIGDLLFLPHKVSKNTNLLVVVFVKVKVEPKSQPDLKEIII